MAASTTPFLSAGLPGLTFGLSLGRGLSIQLDPSGNVIAEEEVNPEEDVMYTKNVGLPNGMLVIHFYALHDLVLQDVDGIVYATFSVASKKKVSSQQEVSKATTLVFDEVKVIPFIVSPKADHHVNRLVIVVYSCRHGEEHAVSKPKHKVLGRYEVDLHTLLKNVTFKEKANLLHKKGHSVGQVEFECCASYGSFGYGNSSQIKNNIRNPQDLVKTSIFPRIPPALDEPGSFRGTSIYPRKVFHPVFIPLQNDPVEDLEPDISLSKNQPVYECASFPLVKQHMQRINQLRTAFAKQPTRIKRITFLRKMLQDGGLAPDNDFDDVSDDDSKEAEAPIPPALALLMNASKLFTHAPGIIKRRRSARQSLPNTLCPDEPEVNPRRRAQSLYPAPSEDLHLRDQAFARRRQSVAPTQN